MRLIDTNKRITLKNWIKQHDPDYPWNWQAEDELLSQLVDVIGQTGDIDLETLKAVFKSYNQCQHCI